MHLTSVWFKIVSMNNPTLSLERVHFNGTPAIKMIVRNADAALRATLTDLGVMPDCTIANYRSIICFTPAELDAVRNPLKPLFGSKGEWLGRAAA